MNTSGVSIKKKCRLSYSITFKLSAVQHAEVHGNRATARYLGINEKQIRDWRSKKLNLMNTNCNAKRLKGAGRQVTDSKREQGLSEWIQTEKRNGKMISRVDIQEKAKSLTTDDKFKASAGWLRRWRMRHQVLLERSAERDLAFISGFNPHMRLYRDGFDMLTSIKGMEKEREFRDKITCALALLELQTAIIIHKYKKN